VRRDPLRRLLALARPLRSTLVLAVLAGAATVGCGVALLAVSGFVIARASEHPPEVALAVGVVGVRAFGLGRGVFRYLERLLSHDAAFRALADLRVQVFRRLERLLPGALPSGRSADLVSRLVSDVDAVQDLFLRGVLPPAVALLAGGGAVTAVLLLLAPAGGALAAGLLLAGLLVPWLAARLAALGAETAAHARGELAASLGDALHGAADLIVNGADEVALDRLDHLDATFTAEARRAAAGSAAASGLTQLVTGATVWTLLLLAVRAAVGGAGPVPVAVVVLTGLAAFEATAPLAAAALQLSAVRASGRRLLAVLDAPDSVATVAHPRPLPAGPGHVVVRAATVAYDGVTALEGVDLDLRPGSRVAVIGASGSGKSTLAALLLRLRDPDAGGLTLDGTPYAQLDDDDVRRVVSGCASDAHVFDSTLRQNLQLARPGAGLEELRDAARRARLLDWIEALPLGWETPVGPHGVALSGGERQRLALARALLLDPAVMVLDEPTAHLDPEARRALSRDLLDATRGRTTLLVTHDLEGLDEVDEVVVLAAGRVVERGRPRDLLSRASRFRALWERAAA
jgi:thiol reductant ABC exporter CydC subunit